MKSDRRRVLVIAAHPDDELLGCGGTIALHTRAGHEVTSVIACEGESVRYGGDGTEQRAQGRNAAEVLGTKEVRWLTFRDQRLDTLTLTDLIAPLEQAVRQIQPHIVYCQHGGDINRDHKLLFEALLVATRPVESCIEAVYSFDTASSTEWAFPRTFVPDTWVDISSSLALKLEAMAFYEKEVKDYPHPRSLKGLEHRAHAWGNQVCLDAAEAFMTVRRVIRWGAPLT